MKRLMIVVFCQLLLSLGYAQLVVPAEVKQRLDDDKSFDRYAYEMMRYVKSKQNAVDATAVEKKYYERQEKFLARQLWWLEGRQDSQGNITNTSERIMDVLRNNSARLDNVIESAHGSWQLVGPTNNVASAHSPSKGQGRVDRFAFHPTDPDIVYAGSPSGGLWKSINGGTTWGILSSYNANFSVSGIVVSWDNPDILYVLTGDGESNGGDNYFVQGFDYIRPSIGVLKSLDGGLTWEETGTFGIIGFYTGYKLVQSPNDPDLLIAATSAGLYRTLNGGATWTRVSAIDRFFDIEWKPGASSRVYAATNDAFFISTNSGATFVNQNDNFDISIGDASRIAIAVTPDNANVVYVFAGLTSNGSDFNKGIYKSTNSGDDFTRGCTNNSIVSSPVYMHNIAVSPTDEDLVIIGTIVLYRSTSGSSCPTQISVTGEATLPNFVHADIHDVVFNPLNGYLYIGSDGGVHRSTNNGTSFTELYSMSTTQFYHFDVSESDHDYMLGGSQDNGTHLRASATSVFTHFSGGDGYEMQFYHGATAPAYFSVNQGLYKTNNTLTGHNEMTGIPDSWYKTIAISYFDNDIAYTGAGQIYKTTNGGTTWSAKGGSGRWALITCPSNSTRIYASGGDNWNDGGDQLDKKLVRSDNSGDSWTELQENTGFPETITKITGIAVDPNNSTRVWVTMGGFTAGEKVYFSFNSGASWSNLTDGLPNIPVNCIAVDANSDIYIGTDIGVYFRSSTMPDWQPFLNFLPRIPITELHIRGGWIYASTFGRGIWRSETHSACDASLGIPLNQSGYRFYQAQNITSSSTIIGGVTTEVYFKAENSVTLTENFRANASTGEFFKAWIANCDNGGIPTPNSRVASGGNLKVTGDIIEFEMPFDAKASLVVLDESNQVRSIISENEVFRKGVVTKNRSNLNQLKGKLVLVIDGELSGQVNL